MMQVACRGIFSSLHGRKRGDDGLPPAKLGPTIRTSMRDVVISDLTVLRSSLLGPFALTAICFRMSYLTLGLAVLVAIVLVAGLGSILGRRDADAATPFVQAVADVGKEVVVPISGNPDAVVREIPSLARRHADLVSKHLDATLTYDAKGVASLDALITSEFDGKPPAYFEPVVMSFGSFAGECIRQTYGGEWAHDEEHGYHLRNVGSGKKTVFPFAKVQERFIAGEEASITDLYISVAAASK